MRFTILCVCFFAGFTIQADTVQLTFSGIATGAYDCYVAGNPSCETLTNMPFTLKFYGPTQSFQNTNNQLPPPISGGSLLFGNINQPLFQSDPGSPSYNQEAFTMISEPAAGSLYLYQGNPLYAILSFASPQLVGYTYDQSLSLSNVTLVPHPQPSGIQGFFLTLDSGSVVFNSFNNVQMVATVTDPPVPEPAVIGLLMAGAFLVAGVRVFRKPRV